VKNFEFHCVFDDCFYDVNPYSETSEAENTTSVLQFVLSFILRHAEHADFIFQ